MTSPWQLLTHRAQFLSPELRAPLGDGSAISALTYFSDDDDVSIRVESKDTKMKVLPGTA